MGWGGGGGDHIVVTGPQEPGGDYLLNYTTFESVCLLYCPSIQVLWQMTCVHHIILLDFTVNI